MFVQLGHNLAPHCKNSTTLQNFVFQFSTNHFQGQLYTDFKEFFSAVVTDVCYQVPVKVEKKKLESSSLLLRHFVFRMVKASPQGKVYFTLCTVVYNTVHLSLSCDCFIIGRVKSHKICHSLFYIFIESSFKIKESSSQQICSVARYYIYLYNKRIVMKYHTDIYNGQVNYLSVFKENEILLMFLNCKAQFHMLIYYKEV